MGMIGKEPTRSVRKDKNEGMERALRKAALKSSEVAKSPYGKRPNTGIKRRE